MKKNLLLICVFIFSSVLFNAFSGVAQNKIRTAGDLQKLLQLKKYYQEHPLEKGQTNASVELLKKYEGQLIAPKTVSSDLLRRTYAAHRVLGSAPLNDLCANATLITEDASCNPTTGDVAGSSESIPPDLCNGFTSTNGYDVWYQFVAVTATPFISVTGSASFDPVIFLFDSCGGTILGCSDATFAGQTETIAASGLTPGNTYFVRVYSYGTGLPVTTTFDICVYSPSSPPANDDCANAVLLTEDVACNPASGDVAGSTESLPPDVCNGFTSGSGYDVWYRFVAATSSPLISVTGSASFDPVVFLFDSCGGSILGCSDNTVSGQTETIYSSGLTPGNTYFVRVYSYGNSLPVTTTFDICVYSSTGPPANDVCSNAISLTESNVCVAVTGDLANATESMPPDFCNGFTSATGYDVWYSFVAVSVNPIISVTGSASFDPVVFLFDSCGGSILGCADATVYGETEIITASGLTPGNTYLVRVYSYGPGLPGTTTFDICVYDPTLNPANDDCANAILLTQDATCNPTTGDVSGATESIPPDFCSGFTSTAGLDVWYSFVATTADPYITVTGNGDFDPVIFLFDSCGGTILGCSDVTISSGTEVIYSSGLTPGNTYFVRVYSYGSTLPATTTFTICVTDAASPPGNDDCSNAVLLTEELTCTPTQGDVAGSSESMPAGTCGIFTSPSAYDVWFKFVAVSAAPFISVTGASAFDAVIFLFDSCGGSELGCSDATVNGQTEVISASGLTPGNTYYVRVYNYGPGLPATTTFDICVYSTSTYAVNDTMCGAIALTLDGAVESGDNSLAAATEYPGDSIVTTLGYICSLPNNTMWYSYTAATTDSFYVEYSADQFFNGWLGVFTSDNSATPCQGNLGYVDCLAGPASGGGPVTVDLGILPPAAGTTYLFMVDGVSGSVGPFSISVISPFTTVGISGITKSGSPSLYPNPSHGIINIHLGSNPAKSIVKMYDVLGHLILEEVVQNRTETILDASKVADGIYFVKIENDNGLYTQRVVLNK